MATPSADEIRAIKPGRTRVFRCNNMRECYSIQSRLTYIKRVGLPAGVANYTSETDKEDCSVIVRAVPTTEVARV